jgi:hypothetical protein
MTKGVTLRCSHGYEISHKQDVRGALYFAKFFKVKFLAPKVVEPPSRAGEKTAPREVLDALPQKDSASSTLRSAGLLLLLMFVCTKQAEAFDLSAAARILEQFVPDVVKLGAHYP